MDVKTAELLKVITKTIPRPMNDGIFNFRCYLIGYDAIIVVKKLLSR